MFLEQQISKLEWFPKDDVTLKTGFNGYIFLYIKQENNSLTFLQYYCFTVFVIK